MEEPTPGEKEFLDWLQSLTVSQVSWAALFIFVTIRFDAATAVIVCLVVYLLRADE